MSLANREGYKARFFIVVGDNGSTLPNSEVHWRMDCPRCEIELVALESETVSLARCPECFGIWTDVSELNRLLLRNNLPMLENLGGRINVNESLGICPECQIDLVAVEGGERRSMAYDTCEHCGGIFVDAEAEAEQIDEAIAAIVDFYRRFQNRGAGKP